MNGYLFAVFLLTICLILVEPIPRQNDEGDVFFRDWVLVRRKLCKPNWGGVTIPVKNDKSDSVLPSLRRYHQEKYSRRHNVILATH